MPPIPPIEPDFRLEEAPEAEIRGYAIEPEGPGDESVFDPSRDFFDDPAADERTIQGENGEELESLGGGSYRVVVKKPVAVRSRPVKTVAPTAELAVPPFRLRRLLDAASAGASIRAYPLLPAAAKMAAQARLNFLEAPRSEPSSSTVPVLLRSALALGRVDAPKMLSDTATLDDLEQAVRAFIKERVDEEDLPFGLPLNPRLVRELEINDPQHSRNHWSRTLSPLRSKARRLVRDQELDDPQHQPHDGRVVSSEPSDDDVAAVPRRQAELRGVKSYSTNRDVRQKDGTVKKWVCQKAKKGSARWTWKDGVELDPPIPILDRTPGAKPADGVRAKTDAERSRKSYAKKRAAQPPKKRGRKKVHADTKARQRAHYARKKARKLAAE